MACGIKWHVEKNDLGEIQGQIQTESKATAKALADEVLTDVIRRMHIPGRGRHYVHQGMPHQASAPGQAPAAEFGDLIASYEVGVAQEGDHYFGIVHSNSRTARALEYGAPARNLAPRPALTPAGEAMKQRAGSIAAERFRRSPFNRSGRGTLAASRYEDTSRGIFEQMISAPVRSGRK